MAILRMLAGKYGYSATEPKDIYCQEYALSCLDDYLNGKTWHMFFSEEISTDQMTAWTEAITKYFKFLNELLEEHKGAYLAGEKMTIADFSCWGGLACIANVALCTTNPKKPAATKAMQEVLAQFETLSTWSQRMATENADYMSTRNPCTF